MHTFAPLQTQQSMKKSVYKIISFREISGSFFTFSKICKKYLKIAKFLKIQVDNIVDLKKCWKTRIYLQISVPLQQKTSEILLIICQQLSITLRVHQRLPLAGPEAAARRGRRAASRRREAPAPRGHGQPKEGKISNFFYNF